MGALGREIDNLNQIRLSDKKVIEFIDDLFPVKEDLSNQQMKTVLLIKHMKWYWQREGNAISTFCFV